MKFQQNISKKNDDACGKISLFISFLSKYRADDWSVTVYFSVISVWEILAKAINDLLTLLFQSLLSRSLFCDTLYVPCLSAECCILNSKEWPSAQTDENSNKLRISVKTDVDSR